MSAWRRSLPAMRSNASARRGSFSIAGQGVVQDDRVAFQLQVVEALLDVDGGHHGIVGHRRRVDSRGHGVSPIARRSAISTAADVLAAMPDLDERLALAERTLTALVADAELPPKIGVHPRPDGSFAHAMPAHLRGADPAGGDDLLGMKWVAGFGTNNALGLPAIHAVVVINDAATGAPVAHPRRRADHGAADRGGVGRRHPAISHRPSAGGRLRAALIGAGRPGPSHLAVLGGLLPGRRR